MHEMIGHTCMYNAFVEAIRIVKLVPSVRCKIEVAPSNNYLYFKSKLVVDNVLLDDQCGRWKTGEIFNFGPPLGT